MCETNTKRQDKTVAALLLPESRSAATHDLALADELGVEFGAVEREVNVKVDAVKSALRGIHAFKILFEVLS